jgi:hypothetical protein
MNERATQMKKTTPQPGKPYQDGDDWYFTYHTLNGDKKMGPYKSLELAQNEFVKALRLHEANGYSDGDISVITSN